MTAVYIDSAPFSFHSATATCGERAHSEHGDVGSGGENCVGKDLVSKRTATGKTGGIVETEVNATVDTKHASFVRGISEESEAASDSAGLIGDFEL